MPHPWVRKRNNPTVGKRRSNHTNKTIPKPKAAPHKANQERYLPWPLWLTSLAAITLFITVCRKSFSPATLGEKRDDMFSCLCRMASSNASLEDAHDDQHQETKGHGKPEVTVTREHKRSKIVSRSWQRAFISQRRTKDRKGNKKDRGRSLIRRTLIYHRVQHSCEGSAPSGTGTVLGEQGVVSHLRAPSLAVKTHTGSSLLYQYWNIDVFKADWPCNTSRVTSVIPQVEFLKEKLPSISQGKGGEEQTTQTRWINEKMGTINNQQHQVAWK